MDSTPYWPNLLQQAAADPFVFDQLLEALLAFSLVKRLAENHLLSIHRLVQAVQLERMDSRAKTPTLSRLNSEFALSKEVSNWSK